MCVCVCGGGGGGGLHNLCVSADSTALQFIFIAMLITTTIT